MNTKKILKKSVIAILITFAILLLGTIFCKNISLGFDTPSYSFLYGQWNGDETHGMPSLSFSPAGWLFPQILQEKTFSGEPDTQFPYEEWTIDIGPGTIYCADWGTIVRFGSFDGTFYYPEEMQGTVGQFKDQERRLFNTWAKNHFDAHHSNAGDYGDAAYTGEVSSTIDYKQTLGPPKYYGFDEGQKVIIITGHPDAVAVAMEMARQQLNKIFDKLNAWTSNIDCPSKGFNAREQPQAPYNGSAEFGPCTVVMETSPHAANGYQLVAEGLVAEDDRVAYLLTAMENCYGNATGEKYNLDDIQSAFWEAVDPEGISETTPNGEILYDKAVEFEEFFLAGKPKIEIDDSEAQIIVNQKTKNYIVGPLRMSYPYHEDISYLKALYLETSNGTIVYDENSKDSEDDLQILCAGQEVPEDNTNGLKKKFPAPDEPFYIKFSAITAGYPTDVKFYADLEYLSHCKMEYNELHTIAYVYQYFGFGQLGGEHSVRRGEMQGSFTYGYSYSYNYYRSGCDCGGWVYDNYGKPLYKTCGGHKTTGLGVDTIDESYIPQESRIVMFQPFVKMGEEPVGTLYAQPLIAALDGTRTYSVIDDYVEFDLSCELGGKVWVDGTAGKENSYDGIFNSQTDTPMPNVKVSLYRVDGLDGNADGEFEGAMLTDENGEYLFEHINSMFQYYVKFTYNGQYYQPTIYNANREDANWKTNSKGLDILDERDGYNAKFREIGSAPENTVDCPTKVEMHTRDELKEAGLIDEFGNITEELDSNGERKSSDEYVNYSMMDSYTCNGTSTKDLYPGFQVFVVEDYLNNLTNTKEVLEFIESDVVELLYADPDAMHYINQGYVLRELVDLALRKDVYKAVLEINGKTETYKYNKREPLETDANGNSYWELQTRISDGYYDYNYSRELFREDYDYKIDNYVMDGVTTSLDNLGLTPESELKIYVTYKYTIRNRSEAIAAAVTEVVDYYDEDYTYIQERSYLGDNDGNEIGKIYLKDNSRYGTSTETKMSAGYKNLYITGNEVYSDAKYDDNTENTLPLSDPDNNKDVYFYVTFLVNKDSNRNNILDEEVVNGTPIGVGKENIAEINGYKSYYGQKAHAPNEGNPQTEAEYKTGDIAGIPDTNSTPGNLDPVDVPKDGKINYDNFENDTDKAPNIRIILNRDHLRTVEGTVWEDTRNVDEQLARIGDGLRGDETGVNGVRVQLVELRDGKDGNKYEYIWKEVFSGNTDTLKPIINNSGIIPDYSISTENANGKYKFTSFAPGNYIVRFIYGSTEDSVLGTKSIDYNTGDEINNPVTGLYSENGYNRRPTDNGYSASAESIGLNKNSYNGHDYKSTSYQIGVDNGTGAYENNATSSYNYNFAAADTGLYSDAKDIMNKKDDKVINIAPNAEYLVDCTNSRKEVEEYSNKDEKNSKAEILASFERIPEYMYSKYNMADMKNLLDQFMRNTCMISESGAIDVNFEYNRTGTEDNFTNTSESGNTNIGGENYDKCGYYVLENLDLGLVQRPKAQLKVTKQITNVKVTLANNSVLFDASDKATNVLWIDHIAHGQDTKNTYKTDNNYVDSMMKNPIVRQSSTNKGKVQLTMDEELMHGSTIQITYAITVANVGEVDYNEAQFYYTGKVGNTGTIVKTNPRVLVDYVGTQVHDYNSNDDNSATRNNLQFNATQNPQWLAISSNDLLSNGFVNGKAAESVKKYTDGHIVITDAISKDLIPIIADQDKVESKIKDAFSKDPLHALETVNDSQSVSGVQLILSQMITQDSSSDDRIYNNMTELVTTHNDVGRRMAYSVVGNQDPTIGPLEIDADDSQEVIILPPFGQQYRYYILGTAVAVILIAGVIMTMVVLKKKK